MEREKNTKIQDTIQMIVRNFFSLLQTKNNGVSSGQSQPAEVLLAQRNTDISELPSLQRSQGTMLILLFCTGSLELNLQN